MAYGFCAQASEFVGENRMMAGVGNSRKRLTFILRRQRPQVRILSGAPKSHGSGTDLGAGGAAPCDSRRSNGRTCLSSDSTDRPGAFRWFASAWFADAPSGLPVGHRAHIARADLRRTALIWLASFMMNRP